MFNRPRGTMDVLPNESHIWQALETKIHNTCKNFGYLEMRTPLFENCQIFMRSMGESSDVVKKEMYLFLDKSGRELSLKPEGTAGVVRSYIEHNMHEFLDPIKLYYITPCYRYERPQAGRLREFHQFGVELLGSSFAFSDVDVISLAYTFLSNLNISGLKLSLNSIGCKNCRDAYTLKLVKYFKENMDKLCLDCKNKIYKNPLRIMDCKKCGEDSTNIIDEAPKTIKNLCSDCFRHFEEVKSGLKDIDINYVVNPKIVRGLDYYEKTVFEITSDSMLNFNGSVLGGGRYNGLAELLGGKHTPGVGFGIGLERLINILKHQNIEISKLNKPQIFVAWASLETKEFVQKIAYSLRIQNVYAEYDMNNHSLKAQMKISNQLECKYSIVIGNNEIQSKKAKIKNMETRDEISINLDKENFEKVIDEILKIISSKL